MLTINSWVVQITSQWIPHHWFSDRNVSSGVAASMWKRQLTTPGRSQTLTTGNFINGYKEIDKIPCILVLLRHISWANTETEILLVSSSESEIESVVHWTEAVTRCATATVCKVSKSNSRLGIVITLPYRRRMLLPCAEASSSPLCINQQHHLKGIVQVTRCTSIAAVLKKNPLFLFGENRITCSSNY